MNINLKTLSQMEEEVKRFQGMIDDAKKRVKSELDKGWYKREGMKDCCINSTAESSALKSTFKVMVYQVNKIFKQY
jgi:hypothetical protein